MQKKIAIFVEGQGELLFVRNMIGHLFEDVAYSFECMLLKSNSFENVPYNHENPKAEVFFRIINASNDEKVVSVIKEREQGLINQGFDKVIGLRDVYSKKYRDLSGKKIDKNLIEKFIKGAENSLADVSDPNKVSLHFSIMEVEAWWISMYSLLEKIHEGLTADKIKDSRGYCIKNQDVEEVIYHPAAELTEIMKMVGLEYGKKASDVEKIISEMDFLDIESGFENERCQSFKRFCQDLIDSAGVDYQLG